MSGSQAPLGFGVMPDQANDQSRYLQAIFDHILKQTGDTNPDPNGGQNYLPLLQALITNKGGGGLGPMVLDQLTGKTQAPVQPELSYPPAAIPFPAMTHPAPMPVPNDSGTIINMMRALYGGGAT